MTQDIKFDGEKGRLESRRGLPDVPLREVRKQIRMELGTKIRSVREMDGAIRDETEIYEITCLMRALDLLPRREPKK